MITLKNDLVVDVDQSNYTLLLDKHKQDKNGKPIYETLGYYGSLAGAVRGAREYCVKKRLADGVHSMSKALGEMARITDEFNALLSNKKRRGTIEDNQDRLAADDKTS